MKKFLVLSLLVLFSFGLAACNTGEDIIDDDDTSEDTTAPTFDGVEDVEIYVGADFDLMDGVTATDDTDGDVTENVTYTGAFDVESTGTYFIKYTVEDDAGNVREATRYITVVIDPSSFGDDMVPNGDFSLGWGAWDTTSGVEGGEANFEVVDEELMIEITGVTSGLWGPRLSSRGIEFEQDKYYEVTFDARAEDPRAIHVQIGEILADAPYYNNFHEAKLYVFDLSTDMETYSFVFAMTEDTNDNGALLFEMGTVEGTVGTDNLLTTVYLDNVAITEVDPSDIEDTEGPIINGIEDETIELDSSFDALEGVTVVDAIEGELTITEDHVTGTVDTSTADEYTLTYTISDEAGNETVETRVITVVEEIEPEWAGYGMEIVESETDVTINYTDIPESWYDVNAQLSNIVFDGAHDTVVFTLTGEEGQDYLFKIEGGDVDTELAITADGTEQTVELDLTGMTETERAGLNLIIVFAQTVGESGSLVIHDIDYVTNEEVVEEDPEWIGYNMDVVETETEVTIDYSDIPANWWEDNAQLTNIDFDGTNNQVDFTFTGEDGQDYLFKIEEFGTDIAAEEGMTADGTEQTVSIDLSSMTETERNGLDLIVVFAQTEAASGTIVIHDIEYTTTEGTTTNQLTTPFGVEINGTTLAWGALPEADGFEIHIEGVTESPFVIAAEIYSFDLSTLSLDPGTYNVQVQAIGDDTTYLDSDLSDAITYTVD